MGDEATAGRIVVGVDGSDAALEALRHAKRLAEALGCRIEAIACFEYPRPYDGYITLGLDYFKEHAQHTLGLAIKSVWGTEAVPIVDARAVHGNARIELVGASEGAELLVLGRRGHGGFGGLLLGSVSSACIGRARCPVLVVHTPERPPERDDAQGSDARGGNR